MRKISEDRQEEDCNEATKIERITAIDMQLNIIN